MEINQIIAINLKTLRTERNLSLGELSKLCGVSKVMLSQIEKGSTNPTINVVWKIAQGLKVPYAALLEQQIHNALLVKKSDIIEQDDNDNHYRIFCFYPVTPNRNFELFQLELDKGAKHVSIGHLEKSLEYVMVLEGQLTLTTNGQQHIVNPNEAIEFSASKEHIYFSSGNEDLKIVSINYYPSK